MSWKGFLAFCSGIFGVIALAASFYLDNQDSKEESADEVALYVLEPKKDLGISSQRILHVPFEVENRSDKTWEIINAAPS